MNFNYDIIVIGGGHAGCEAAAASSNLGSRTLLITMDMNKIAQMSCNPAIGGIAKGQIVREIDAMGGYMGIVADQTAIQFRMLNKSKGPAMWSPRSQNDRSKYISTWQNVLSDLLNLHIWQDTVSHLLLNTTNRKIIGVKTMFGIDFYASAIIITAGTFLNGLMHMGKVQLPGGRISEPASYGLTDQLNRIGIHSDRMKTGTPVRVDARSINFDELEEQPGENDFRKFSYLDTVKRELKSLSCWTLFTNEACHNVLRDGLPESPLYNGQIKSIGPRYCPSVETKITIFPEKTKHQLFLEPEGENTNEYYLNGFSSSLPFHIQLNALKQIPAFRHIQLFRPGYAIEYDFFDPTQLMPTLESKKIENLFFAGQVNGTTGYEEAAAQGLMAGINAHLKINQQPPFVLSRNDAYIGVLIDDLVNKGVDEPYRMFTSRAEFRILLRQDNADLRLTEKAHHIGLANNQRYSLLNEKMDVIASIINYIKLFHVKPERINTYLTSMDSAPIKQGIKLIELLKRPQIQMQEISSIIPELKEQLERIPKDRKDEIIEEMELTIKYSGYIKREQTIAEKVERLDNVNIKNKFDYNAIHALSTEARQKLKRIDPETIGQASRIPGISPSDINILLVLLGR